MSAKEKSTLKDKLISVAEVIDAWRIVPRVLVVAYSYMVIKLYSWFVSIPTQVVEKCDSSLIKLLTENQLTLDQAKEIACSVVDVVGGPTTAQSAFVTTIIGLSTAIFGLYAHTGRKWGNTNSNNNNNSAPPVIVNYPSSPVGPPNPNQGPSPVSDVKFEP